MIATDPVRFRPLMAVAIFEKFSYVITLVALYAQGRLQGGQIAPALPDFVLGSLFIAGFLKTKPSLAQ